MRIAYSCAGEGFGHAARLVVMGPRLAARHEILYCVPEEVRPFLERKMPGFTARAIPCLAFAKRRDRIELFRTVRDNLPRLLRFPFTVRRLAAWLRAAGVQAVVSDFDPFLAWAGRAAGLPVFQFNHPGIVADCMGWHPLSWIQALAAKFLEGPWTERAHISFYKSPIGPLFRPAIFRHPVSQGGHILVNLTKESYRRPVLGLLRGRHPGLEIRVFPDPAADFEASLASCRAVISSAGHQMIAEALALGKPVLALPQRGQWEQTLNARMLAATGRGMASSLGRLEADLPRFLAGLEAMAAWRNPLPAGFTVDDGTERLERRIVAFLARLTKTSPSPDPLCAVHYYHELAENGGGLSHVVALSPFNQAGQPGPEPKTGAARLSG
jgi:UDP:flavonoid glycosyltransferase YjiC (YdhE family)